MRKASKSRDHLTTTTSEGRIELAEKELTRVTGGLKLGDIKGESVDSKHKGEIDVLAW
jgi:hypothetical protein